MFRGRSRAKIQPESPLASPKPETLELVIDDEPDVVALHRVSRSEFPLRAEPHGPSIRDGRADFGSDAVIPIAIQVLPPRLLADLPRGESGHTSFEGIRAQSDLSADSPIDIEVVSRFDSGRLLLEV